MDARDRRPVTLKTIADAVGVSRTTVSNAYSRPDQLTPELRERILSAAAELGYSGPNAAARTLRTGRSGAIGVLYTELLSYAFTDPAAILVLQGLAEATEDAGIGLLLLPVSPDHRADPQAVYDAVVDSFIVYSTPVDDARLEAVLARWLPTVIIDEPLRAEAAYIGIDDRAAAQSIAEHLLAHGHERFAVVTFSMIEGGFIGLADLDRQAAATFPMTQARLRGYADALEAAGLPWADVPVYECWPNGQTAGADAAGVLLDRRNRPTAILATSDQLAIGVLGAAAERGLRVPDQLSVAGFDDIPTASLVRPSLTTARQPHLDKGRIAGKLLLDGWPAAEPPRVMLPTELVVRASTGPAPA